MRHDVIILVLHKRREGFLPCNFPGCKYRKKVEKLDTGGVLNGNKRK